MKNGWVSDDIFNFNAFFWTGTTLDAAPVPCDKILCSVKRASSSTLFYLSPFIKFPSSHIFSI